MTDRLAPLIAAQVARLVEQLDALPACGSSARARISGSG